jgi:phage antirepressor YoqD-like protein
MYEVVIRSDKPEATAFRRWVTAEVLPAIRKTGAYSATPALTEDQIIAQALQLTTARVEKLTARLAIVEPKAAAFDRWLSSNVHYGVAEVSQALHDLGADTGRNRLFAYMQDQGWVYRDQRGDWRPYQAQIETRRLAVKLSRCENSRTGEEFATHTVRITAKGAVALAVMLNVAPADLAAALTALDQEAAS